MTMNDDYDYDDDDDDTTAIMTTATVCFPTGIFSMVKLSSFPRGKSAATK